MANIVSNLTNPSLDLDKTWARTRPPLIPTLPILLRRGSMDTKYHLLKRYHLRTWFYFCQMNPPDPSPSILSRLGGGGGIDKEQHLQKGLK